MVNKTVEYIKSLSKNESSGHDWWHIYRVWKNAIFILKTEKANRIEVELGALLHDIADFKFNNGDFEIGAIKAGEWLKSLGADKKTVEKVQDIVTQVSYKGDQVDTTPSSIEGMIVQDADRLDALGAIGIARCFAYGGHKGRMLYDPDIKPVSHQSKEAYSRSVGTSINHFYEKLLLIKDRMNTKTAKRIAEKRHQYIEEFLLEFYKEWEGRLSD